MMESRLIIWLPLWVVLSLLLNGCSILPASDTRTYTETISQFVIIKGGQQMVFLGESYHYAFTISPGLKNILTGPERYLLKDQLAYIKSETFDGLISARYDLVCDCRNASHMQILWLKAQGFEAIVDRQFGYIKSNQLKGSRLLTGRLNRDQHAIFTLSDEQTVVVEKVPPLRRVRDRSVMDRILSFPSSASPLGRL